jgi:hypothetical protein
VFAKSIADVGVSLFGIDSNAMDSGSPQALVKAVMNGDTTAVTELVSTQLTVLLDSQCYVILLLMSMPSTAMSHC